MYHYRTEIPSTDNPSTIPDISFRPDSALFAATFKDINRVKLYDADQGVEVRCYQNPEAELDWPHGVVLSHNHMLVSNKLNPTDRPSIITVYRLDSEDTRPVCRFHTPLAHLREAHSLSLHGDKLLVTYCGHDIAALLCYEFDDQTGQIGQLLGTTEDWFHSHGEPKGVSFTRDGRHALVTYVTPKRLSRANLAQRMLRMIFTERKGLRRFSKLLLGKLTGRRTQKTLNQDAYGNLLNGIALFGVASDGRLSAEPLKVFPEKKFTRYENLELVGDRLVVVDPANDSVHLHQASDDGMELQPDQVIDNDLHFPHDAGFSSDLSRLVVANHGIAVENGTPQWGQYKTPRQDKLMIFSQ